MRGATS